MKTHDYDIFLTAIKHAPHSFNLADYANEFTADELQTISREWMKSIIINKKPLVVLEPNTVLAIIEALPDHLE